MKQAKLFPVLGLLIAGFSIQSFAQEQVLPEVTVTARNYKYLKAVDNKEGAQPVRLLQHQAAAYDVKSSEYYQQDFDTYSITFYLPSGYILAEYDASGKILSTVERFKNVGLPAAVREAVVKQYPGWKISEDVFLVTYKDESAPKKVYKLVLQDGSKRLRIKANDKGEIVR